MTRQVQLADDAYDRLRSLKRPGESFSDVVRRLTRPKGSLLDLSRIGLTKTQHAKRMQALQKTDEADQADAARLERR